MKEDDASRPGAALRRITGWGLALFVAGAVVVSSCGSLSKPGLERELRALAKNRPVGELRRLAMDADLGDGPRTYELVYTHVPATRADARDATPVVLVHGTPSTLFSWVEIVHGGEGFAGLAQDRDVVALEMVGHGVAPGDAAPYTFERCARFVNAAIRALGLGRVHLVGSSYGGEFAWRAALNDPASIASLVLLDPSGYPRADGDWLPEEVEMREHPLAKLGWLLNSRERVETALAPHFDPIPPDRVDEFFLVCENRANWCAMIDLVRDEDGARAGELTSLAVPTLVVWGAEDIAYPLEDYGQRFAADIPGAELVVIEEAGHYPHEARPAAVVEALADFFARP